MLLTMFSPMLPPSSKDNSKHKCRPSSLGRRLHLHLHQEQHPQQNLHLVNLLGALPLQ